MAQGSFSGAIPALREALTSAPDDTATLRLLAESLVHVAADESDPERKRAAYGEALGYARRIAAARPDDPDVVHLVGRAALGAGQLEQAESLFLHVLSLDPRQCYAMVNLGRTYMAMSRWSEAESFLKQAASCAPRLAAVYETLGDLYLQRGMTQLAADAFRRADEIEPNSSPGTRPARAQSTPETTRPGPLSGGSSGAFGVLNPTFGCVRVPPLRRPPIASPGSPASGRGPWKAA